jgi:hypothetical protein
MKISKSKCYINQKIVITIMWKAVPVARSVDVFFLNRR